MAFLKKLLCNHFHDEMTFQNLMYKMKAVHQSDHKLMSEHIKYFFLFYSIHFHIFARLLMKIQQVLIHL
jgi:hypothetical protein